MTVYLTVVGQSLFLTLSAEDDINLLHELGEGKFFVPKDHPPGLDPGHIQDIVDQA